MTIIVSKGGDSAIKVEKCSFEHEDYLQQFICKNPDSVPLNGIKEGIRLLILAREFAVGAGKIDVLGVDREGELYIIETKLYKNPDKRAVVAQVLDYGASLWKHGHNFDDFIGHVEANVNRTQRGSLDEQLTTFYGLSEQETEDFRRNMKHNLIEGSFKFVVLMDSLHQGLKDLIVFLNQNTRFSLYAVEVEYYKHEGFEIVIPKLFGAEVQAPVSPVPTRETFLKTLRASAGDDIATLAEQMIEEVPEHGLYVEFVADGASFKFEDTFSTEIFNIGKVQTDGMLVTGLFSQKCVALQIPKDIFTSYYNALRKLTPESEVRPWGKGKWLWLADANDDWPSAAPLLRQRKQWFKTIRDTMDQIQPLLRGPRK
jgi:hypothetical protein